MRLTNFKKALHKLTDATWEQVERNHSRHGFGSQSLQEITEDELYADDVMTNLFHWRVTSEGVDYWYDNFCKLRGITDEVVESWPTPELKLEDCVIGPFKNPEQMEQVYNYLRDELGQNMVREDFNYVIYELSFSYRVNSWRIDSNDPNISPEDFLERFSSTDLTNQNTEPEVSQESTQTCDCRFPGFYGHTCEQFVDASKGLGLVDKEAQHRELVALIKNTCDKRVK